MEKGVQKFLKKLVLEKYPMFLDVHVAKGAHKIDNKDVYEVFLIIFEKDFAEMENSVARQVKEYIKNLGKYMDIKISGVFNAPVDDDEWEEMKIKRKD